MQCCMCRCNSNKKMSFWRYESNNSRGSRKLLEEEKNDNTRSEVFAC